MLQPEDFFDLSDSLTADLFAGCEFVWQVVEHLAEKLNQMLGGKRTILGEVMPGAYLSDKPVYIGHGAIVNPGAYIEGPASRASYTKAEDEQTAPAGPYTAP